MLSPEEINDIHYQLNNIPPSFTSKRKCELRRELNNVLNEHKYASTYSPYEPSKYELVFVNRITSIDTLITLDTKIKETNIFTLDTESITRKFQPNRNKIFIWGEIEELLGFTQFNLFDLQQIYSSTNRNVQREFKLYWEKFYPHHVNPDEECHCKHCFGIEHNNSLSLQDAVASELPQWLDKRLTCQLFNIGLDSQLRKLNPRELQYRQSLCTYAANGCNSIYRIIIHSNIINNQYSEASPVNGIDDEFLLAEKITRHGGGDGVDEEIVLGENGQAMIIGEPSSIVTLTDEPPLFEPISSDDEEPMDFALKRKQSNKLAKHDEPEFERNHDQRIKTPDVQVDPPAARVTHINPLSEEERKKIHNKSRTRHRRKKAYAREIILYNIEKRFPVKLIKQMLKERGVFFTQVNPVKSKRTGQITLYIGIKEPIQMEKYEEIKELFTYENYRRLFPHKFKRRSSCAHGYGQRRYR